MEHSDLIAWAKREKYHGNSIGERLRAKKRIVLRGDAVSGQNGLDLAASAPSSIAGLNFVIGYGQFLSHKCSTAGAIKAYIQKQSPDQRPAWALLPDISRNLALVW